MIDVGERSFPVFFDENADGLKDIISWEFWLLSLRSGNYSSQLMLLRNTGTMEEPAFEMINQDYAELAEF